MDLELRLVWNLETELADAPLLGVTKMAVHSPSRAGEPGVINNGTQRAIELLEEALELLDQANAPPDIGAHVKTAIDVAEGHGLESPSDLPLS